MEHQLRCPSTCADSGQILISEFRTRGAGTTPPGSDGSADEFIEIYHNTDQSITIIDAIPGADPTSPTGAGWRFAGAQGAAETTFLVLPQTLSTAGPLALPPRGYFLISTQPTTPSPAGNTYSLFTYPTGTGITASGSANVSVNPASATVGFLPDDVGLAVFQPRERYRRTVWIRSVTARSRTPTTKREPVFRRPPVLPQPASIAGRVC